MPKQVEVDNWSTDAEPLVISVSGRTFRIRPVSFNQALRISQLVSALGEEYSAMLEEEGGRGEASFVTDRETNLMIEQLLAGVEFTGLLPDWFQRRRLAMLLARKPIIARVATIRALADHFTEYLRTLLDATGLGTGVATGA